ncbi:hypothetical protein WP50_12735 [Lactiplantibacillus plantarum]|nr:hypothetical protein WP50_12735 [Lactiplantibacillus plantarum]
MTKPQTLIIATNNANKAREFSAMLAPYDITIKTLADFPNIPEIKENGITFEENATKKATVVVEATGLPAIADDSGLMVKALHGDPGVFSAAETVNDVSAVLDYLDIANDRSTKRYPDEYYTTGAADQFEAIARNWLGQPDFHAQHIDLGSEAND